MKSDWVVLSISSLALSLFTLSFSVLLKRYKDIPSIFYSLFMLGASLWAISILGFHYNLIFSEKTIWLKLTHSFGLLIPLTLYLFVTRFYEDYRFKDIEIFLIIATTFLLILVMVTDSIIQKALDTSYKIGNLYIVYSFLIIFIFLLCYFVLLNNLFLIKEAINKIQNILIFIGILLSSIPVLIVDLILPYFEIFSYTWLGPLFTFIGIICFALAIFRYRLFNIPIITAEILVFLLWYFSLFRMLGSLKEEIQINLVSFLISFILGILLIRYVTVEVEQREKLEELTKELEKLNKLRAEFLSIASHQIRSPMVNIRGFIELLLHGQYGTIADKAKEVLLKIYRNINDEINLVNNLLDYRKIEEGKIEYNFENINIVQVVKGIYDFYKVRAEEKNLDFILNLEKENIVIKGDEEKLTQAIANLVDNAIKYTDSGFVKISVNEEENNVLITVQDSGRGIESDYLQKIFEGFERGKTDRKIAGSGLGLYIAKEFIKAHNGEIWTESEGPGKGSTFYVKLPLQ